MPALLTDPDARKAYDRLARAKFEEHICANHPRMQVAIPPPPDDDSFDSRARKLISRGYKPKDAVELVLEEILLEHRHDPKKIEQARADAEDFLSALRRGL
jgi:hypothetical protein